MSMADTGTQRTEDQHHCGQSGWNSQVILQFDITVLYYSVISQHNITVVNLGGTYS